MSTSDGIIVYKVGGHALLQPSESTWLCTNAAKRTDRAAARIIRAPADLRPLCPSRSDENGEKSVGRGDEQPVFSGAAEGEIGHHRWQLDLAQRVARWREADHAVARARPEIAHRIEPKTIRHSGRNLAKDLAAREAVVGADSEAANVMWPLWIMARAGIRDVEMAFVG